MPGAWRPEDADLVADCRFLPNPFWIPELRPHTGQDAEVRDYVLGQADADTFITTYLTALGPVLTGYRKENKRHATIAIGCTGGKHRSVAVAEELARRMNALPGVAVQQTAGGDAGAAHHQVAVGGGERRVLRGQVGIEGRHRGARPGGHPLGREGASFGDLLPCGFHEPDARPLGLAGLPSALFVARYHRSPPRIRL